ncbi:hypothetical protein V8G54_035122 [Vigna mungo]|uniref:Uncharacterized protein n=1 Tax=Vigna mungo TaxID=3915 RepID=A0AAQ3RE26_VIGMU
MVVFVLAVIVDSHRRGQEAVWKLVALPVSGEIVGRLLKGTLIHKEIIIIESIGDLRKTMRPLAFIFAPQLFEPQPEGICYFCTGFDTCRTVGGDEECDDDEKFRAKVSIVKSMLGVASYGSPLVRAEVVHIGSENSPVVRDGRVSSSIPLFDDSSHHSDSGILNDGFSNGVVNPKQKGYGKKRKKKDPTASVQVPMRQTEAKSLPLFTSSEYTSVQEPLPMDQKNRCLYVEGRKYLAKVKLIQPKRKVKNIWPRSKVENIQPESKVEPIQHGLMVKLKVEKIRPRERSSCVLLDQSRTVSNVVTSKPRLKVLTSWLDQRSRRIDLDCRLSQLGLN